LSGGISPNARPHPRLLFEIGCEELPAFACREAEAQLPGLCKRFLGRAPDRLFIGPRRLALVIDELPTGGVERVVKGPAERIAFDERGAPTQAARGFAKKSGVDVEELERRDGAVWARIPGESVVDALPERLPQLVRGLAFSKSMVAEAGGFRFARPVRWLLAKLDGETLRVSVDGLTSGDETYGHRWTHPAKVKIANAGTYEKRIRGAGVEPDAAARRREIIEALDALGDWRDPAGVLDEVVHLVEKPLVLDGDFDERFLELPERVVVTAMQSHQRYFPLGGTRFAVVANAGEPDVVRAGHTRVLESRLEDASFTFERDVAVGVEGLVGRLGSIVFVQGAGTYAEQSGRLVRLVEALGGGEASREAARLAKADLASELVREFPELQGYIGGEYSRLAGYPEAVAAAIEEQYLPDVAGGPLPSTDAGKVLAAADKIDTLTVAFGLGSRPSGSRDPYGLRRAAIGLCRLALEGGLRIDVRELVALDHRLLVAQNAELVADFDAPEVTDFVAERLEGLLDVPVEFVRAARRSTVGELGGTARLALTLAGLAPDVLETLHTAYTRADRLGGKAEDVASTLDRGLLQEEAERAVTAVLEKVEGELPSRVAAQEFDAAVVLAAELGPPLARFFDEVLVMAEDQAVRANRLRLLVDVRDALATLGDFSQLSL
jgi:glycyl-tRNA synthetase beta chain